jgi:uncharacterized protein HemX
MKHTIKSGALLLASALILALSICGIGRVSAQQQSKERRGAKTESKEEYEKKIQAKLDKLDRQIEALKAKAAAEGAQAQRQLKTQLKELDRQHQAAARQLDEVRAEGEETWQKMKPKVDAALDELEKAYQKVASYFR